MKRGNKAKFGRERKVRKALARSLVTSLIEHGKIKTTQAKAKMVAHDLEKMITLAKKNNQASQRLIRQKIGTKATQKLFTEIGPRLVDRKGGYTRVTKLGPRRSDGAPIAVVEIL